MKWLAHFLFWSGGFLIGLAAADFSDAMQGVEAPPPIYRPAVHPMLEEMSAEEREKSTCLHLPQKGVTYSIVVLQGVTCVTRVESLR